jgi:hypothetical protein
LIIVGIWALLNAFAAIFRIGASGCLIILPIAFLTWLGFKLLGMA